jgi:hypothetical protein
VQVEILVQINPLLLLFKALLHRQKDCVFFQRAFNLHIKTSALERLGRHGTFKSRALWSVRDSKGLNEMEFIDDKKGKRSVGREALDWSF